MYQSFTLKYRPRTFEDVVGQEHVSRTIKNAVAAGRIHHAYLFTGPRGTGKTTTARVLARALNCVNGPTPNPCGVCPMCAAIGEGRAMDVVEIDAASNNSVDDVRELREKVKYAPAEGRAKLYILDEVHMLSTGAFNALLKTLEEPPPHAYFALLTTEMHKIPETIVSRCQRFDFRPISSVDAANALRKIAEAEGLQVQPEALMVIARAAEGAMRDAQSIFEQVVAFSEGPITLDIVNQVLGVTEAETLAHMAQIVAHQDLPAVFGMVDQLIAEGKDLGRLIEDFTLFLRDLLRLALGSQTEAWLQLGPEGEVRMRELAESMGAERLLDAVHKLAELRVRMKTSSQHALLLELTLAELCSLEKRGSHTVTPQPVAPAPVTASASVSTPAQAPVPAPVAPPPEAPVASPPAPQPTVAPVPEETVTCEFIWQQWDKLSNQLRRMNRLMQAALIKHGVPIKLQDGCLTIGFAPDRSAHYARIKDDQEILTQALTAMYGKPLRVVCHLCTSVEEAQPPTGTVSSAEASAPLMAEPSASSIEEPPYAPDLPAEPDLGMPVADLEAPPPIPDVAPHTVPLQVQTQSAMLEATSEAADTAGMTGDQAVEQTLSLFDGAEEISSSE